MRLLLLTILIMGGLSLVMAFALADTARLQKTASRPVTVTFHGRYGSPQSAEILPRILGDEERAERSTTLTPTGRLEALREQYGRDPTGAVDGLRRMDRAEAVNILVQLHDDTEAASERERIRRALATMHHPSARSALLRLQPEAPASGR